MRRAPNLCFAVERSQTNGAVRRRLEFSRCAIVVDQFKALKRAGWSRVFCAQHTMPQHEAHNCVQAMAFTPMKSPKTMEHAANTKDEKNSCGDVSLHVLDMRTQCIPTPSQPKSSSPMTQA
eukprot:CAMPEP_0172691346 /NCGR_PEP_ID=MMETSP1074-20121228/24487_1 /TAXON_ID=2916 /ORGANISM="Ceratium fusus, Strain PA161109" /LENGTH=120 /DNA_ID=CAMNT_0013511395 /DNA_START=107 /DNA_END=470 /DNA_ORIENTATION=+